jgi:large-conductance mechanosensitive channel
MPISMDEEGGHHRQWHLEKSVSISHIISTLLIAGSVFVYIGKIDTRIALLEQAQTQQKSVDLRQDSDQAEAFREFRDSMKAIGLKLDRIIERNQK